VALVIGNGAYRHASALRNPGNDARAVSAALRRLGFEVITGLDLDRNGLEQGIRELARRARGADAALFYCSGHGLEVAGRNYLVPVDARLEEPADLSFETLAARRWRSTRSCRPSSRAPGSASFSWTPAATTRSPARSRVRWVPAGPAR
jgi:uncharacterized caspase-like protein